MGIKPAGNTYVGYLQSKGYSSLNMSFYLSKLIFDFSPWLSVDDTGRNQYDKSNRLSTSVNFEGASYLYLTSVSILRGDDSTEQIEATLPCKNNASLTLSYMPDENNHMAAYLVINKDTRTIPFRFNTTPKQVMINGKMVTKAVQTDLGIFAMTLLGYVIGIGAEDHLKRIFEENLNP